MHENRLPVSNSSSTSIGRAIPRGDKEPVIGAVSCGAAAVRPRPGHGAPGGIRDNPIRRAAGGDEPAPGRGL